MASMFTAPWFSTMRERPIPPGTIDSMMVMILNSCAEAVRVPPSRSAKRRIFFIRMITTGLFAEGRQIILVSAFGPTDRRINRMKRLIDSLKALVESLLPAFDGWKLLARPRPVRLKVSGSSNQHLTGVASLSRHRSGSCHDRWQTFTSVKSGRIDRSRIFGVVLYCWITAKY